MVLPSMLINGFQTPDEMIQAGIFGLGPNNKLNQWTGRADLSYQLMWQLDAMGIGNLARIKEQRGEQSREPGDLRPRGTTLRRSCGPGPGGWGDW